MIIFLSYNLLISYSIFPEISFFQHFPKKLMVWYDIEKPSRECKEMNIQPVYFFPGDSFPVHLEGDFLAIK